jgi:cell division protein FtsL
MVKMLLCILSAMALAVMTLQLRQQRLELNFKISQLHREIESNQARLWNQQLQIAVYTAPNAIQQTVSNKELHMIPRGPAPRGAAARPASWLDDPDAE